MYNAYQDAELYCPACGRPFKTPAARNSHLAQSKHCSWYRKGKNREGRRRTMRTHSPDPLPADEDEIPADPIIEIPPDQVMQEWEDDIFDFIPADLNVPGPSSVRQRPIPVQPRHLEDDDDSRIIESHPTAGRVIRMNDNLHAKWKRSFGLALPDPDGDIEMGVADPPNSFAPFASELDWRIAEWVIKDGPGHKAFDRLLNIPGVRFLL